MSLIRGSRQRDRARQAVANAASRSLARPTQLTLSDTAAAAQPDVSPAAASVSGAQFPPSWCLLTSIAGTSGARRYGGGPSRSVAYQAAVTHFCRGAATEFGGTTAMQDRFRSPAHAPNTRRAAALARHYRDQEGVPIAQIARRLERAEATVKAYPYDPTGEKARAVKARYVGGVPRLGRLHPAA